ncbi:MAG: hypothetical protein PHQ81_05870 [Methanofollis sp.]|nr:hypothetical protein [Methanofollis sp.]
MDVIMFGQRREGGSLHHIQCSLLRRGRAGEFWDDFRMKYDRVSEAFTELCFSFGARYHVENTIEFPFPPSFLAVEDRPEGVETIFDFRGRWAQPPGKRLWEGGSVTLTPRIGEVFYRAERKKAMGPSSHGGSGTSLEREQICRVSISTYIMGEIANFSRKKEFNSS